jgi:hypothetical protein
MKRKTKNLIKYFWLPTWNPSRENLANFKDFLNLQQKIPKFSQKSAKILHILHFVSCFTISSTCVLWIIYLFWIFFHSTNRIFLKIWYFPWQELFYEIFLWKFQHFQKYGIIVLKLFKSVKCQRVELSFWKVFECLSCWKCKNFYNNTRYNKIF